MPGIVPKNISTRQSGQITSGTQKVGNPKSSGSIKRIEKTCPECIDVLFKPPVLKPLFDEYDKPFKLFDIESFDKIDNAVERMNTNEPGWNPNNNDYKSAIIYAANRWSKLITLHSPTVFFFRKLMKDGGWKGIYLANIIFQSNTTDDPSIARCDPLPHVYEQSSFVKGFNLYINLTKMNNYYQTSAGNILTHELGHALGMPLWSVYKNGTTSSGVMNLPIVRITQDYPFWHCLSYISIPDGSPYGSYRIGHYSAVQAYNLYGGTDIGELQKTLETNKLGEFESNEKSSEKFSFVRNDKLPLVFNMDHFTRTPIYVTISIFTDDIVFRGLHNEIMTPYYEQNTQYFITNISIGYLLDMGTWYDDVFYHNYEKVIGGGSQYDGSEVTSKPTNVNDVLHFSGVAPEHTTKSNDKSIYNIEPETELVCNCCNLNNNK
jgi:hypothetical protein